MGADNWGTCPKCADNNRNIWERWKREAAEAYGKVSPEEYEQKRKAAEIGPDWDKETFREDYEIGLYKDGKFRVSYGGGCNVCGFNHEYKFEEVAYRP